MTVMKHRAFKRTLGRRGQRRPFSGNDSPSALTETQNPGGLELIISKTSALFSPKEGERE